MSKLDKLRLELKSLDDAIVEAEDTDDTGMAIRMLGWKREALYDELNALEKSTLLEMKNLE